MHALDGPHEQLAGGVVRQAQFPANLLERQSLLIAQHDHTRRYSSGNRSRTRRTASACSSAANALLGDGPAAASLEPAPTDFHDRERASQRSLFGLFNTITLGVEGTGMTAFPHLSDAERWSLAFYVGGLHADTAALADAGADLRMKAAACKLFVSERCFEVADKAVQIHGNVGVTRGHPVEQTFRKLRMFRIFTGTSEIQRNTIARAILEPLQQQAQPPKQQQA